MKADREIAQRISADMLDYADRLNDLGEEFLAFDAARALAVSIRRYACRDRGDYDAMTEILQAIGQECGRLAHDVIISLAPKGDRL